MQNACKLADPVAFSCADGEIDDQKMKAAAQALAMSGSDDATTGAAIICAAAMLVGYLAGQDGEPFEAIKGLVAEFDENARDVLALQLRLTADAEEVN